MSDIPTTSVRNMRRVGIIAAIAAIIAVGLGLTFRAKAYSDLKADSTQSATLTVVAVPVKRATASAALVLPGSIQALNSAAIYAQTSGYLRHWSVDIGDAVRRGQTLATIDTPDVMQQLAQARADYQTALANRQLAQTTAARWSALLAKDAVSKQEADEKSGDLSAKSALANAARANVRRLEAQRGFAVIHAPFDGIVTSRTTQVGALIIAGSATATPLFTVSDVRRVRVFIRVPQASSAQITNGMHATLTVPEYPARSFDVIVTRSAGAVDPQSGSMLVELQADNHDHALKPGAYAQVTLPLVGSVPALQIPSSALISRGNGTFVATVDAQNKVKLLPIKLGQDDGMSLEVLAGLRGNERVIDTPPDAIADGDLVRVTSGSAGRHAKN
jgi:RND family efflux transporter MFP subunit